MSVHAKSPQQPTFGILMTAKLFNFIR